MRKYVVWIMIWMLGGVWVWGQETATYSLGSFSQVEIIGDFEVVLRSGNKEEVRVESHGIPLSEIKVYLRGDRLYIRRKTFSKEFRRDSGATITVTFTKLNGLTSIGSSNVMIESKVNSKHYVIKSVGSGKIESSVDCERFTVELMGSGEIVLHGNAQELEAELTGTGNIEAYDLESLNADVDLVGTGNIKVNVTGKLEASVIGPGDLQYKGNPKQVSIEGIVSGSISKEN